MTDKMKNACWKAYKKTRNIRTNQRSSVRMFDTSVLKGASKFMSRHVYKWIEDHNHTDWIRTEADLGCGTCLEVWNNRESVGISKNTMDTFVSYVRYLTVLFDSMAGRRPRNLVIRVVACNVPKCFPGDHSVVLGSDDVNSGVSWQDSHGAYVLVYRTEDVFKVVAHELIHAYNLDFRAYDYAFDAFFMDHFHACVQTPYKHEDNPLALYEAYTEVVAAAIHITSHVLFSIQPNTLRECIPHMTRVNAKEKKFLLRQARNVFRYMRAHGKYMEDTHCFSYYAVKAAWFQDDKSLSWLCNKVGNKPTPFTEFLSRSKVLVVDTFRKHGDLRGVLGKPMHMTHITNGMWTPKRKVI
jgi:hypothetical protein